MRRPLPFLFTAILAGASAPAFAQDSDGDGVPDAADAFPCDPTLASVVYAPSETGWAMLAYEDLWPVWSDLDYNDVVVRTQFRLYRDAQGLVRRISAFFDPTALGGDYDNGLALQLPVSRSGVTARRRVASGEWQDLSLEADANATVIISDNLRELFGGVEGPINSRSEGPTLAGQRIELELTFSSPASLSTGLAPYDVFIFRSGDFGHQIHFPAYGGTQAMRTELLGTGNDRSVQGRYFVHSTGTPFALNLQGTSRYPSESVMIDQLFPDIVPFAYSAGALNTNFYLSTIVGSAGRLAPDALAPAVPEPSTSCLVAFSHTFTTCGVASGRDGPSLTQCRNSYAGPAWVNDSSSFSVSGGIQLWTVPTTGTYRIEARGAGSNHRSTQAGAVMAADFTLTAGEQLRILVGQISTRADHGSGGTFVARSNNTPIIVAGGSGGISSEITGTNTVTRGGTRLLAVPNTCNGNNTQVGYGGVCAGCCGGGGAGYYGNERPGGNEPAMAFVNGGRGSGQSGRTSYGGFGGGAVDRCESTGRSGGGGGYSGGNAGCTTSGQTFGTGGGSFLASGARNIATSDGRYEGATSFEGRAISNLSSYHPGNGRVVITFVGP